jgi:integrase
VASVEARCDLVPVRCPRPDREQREQLSPHSLRHSAITFALDAGASLRDVQDYVGHKDPRTTRRNDHARDSLERNAAYTVAAYLA